MRKIALCTLLAAAVAYAQFGRGAGDFSTSGADAQRSSWIRSDAKISPTNLQKPGFSLLWKVKLNNEAKQSASLTPAALLTSYIGYRGFRALGFVGGSSDKVFAMDTDLGRIEWQKPIASSSSTCGMTANVTRPVSAAFPPAGGVGRGFGGRGGAAKSGVGEPGEGSVVLKEIEARNVAAGGTPQPGRRGGGNNAGRGAPAAPGAPGAPPPGFGGGRRMPNYLHAISSDGMFHSMYVSNGEEPEPPIKFLPPNSSAMGLIVIDNVAYTVTGSGCGSAANTVWALDIAGKQAASWQASGGGIAGSDGVAFGPDGTLYVATAAGELAALEAKTLKVRDIFKAGVPFTTSPVVFQDKEAVMVAAAAKDGRIYVVDGAKLDGPVSKSDPLPAPPDTLASWQDSAGTRYLLASTANALAAIKFADQSGTPALSSAWTRDIASPLAPLVVNGVVFAGTTGKPNTPAVLYALDGATGNPLWDSGKTIASFVKGGGISGGGSQIYLGTNDGTFYAFGFPIEH